MRRSCRHYEAEARINADAQRDVARINADAELVRKHDYKFLHHPPPPYGDDSVDVMQVDQQIGTYPDQDRAYAAAQRDLAPQRDDVQPAQLARPCRTQAPTLAWAKHGSGRCPIGWSRSRSCW